MPERDGQTASRSGSANLPSQTAQIQQQGQQEPKKAPSNQSSAYRPVNGPGAAMQGFVSVASTSCGLTDLPAPSGRLHILSPQTGGWLAGLSSIVLLAAGVCANAVDIATATTWHASGLAAEGGEAGSAALAALRAASVLAMGGTVMSLGRLLLSPGFSLDSSPLDPNASPAPG
jgi:hypothetical protein